MVLAMPSAVTTGVVPLPNEPVQVNTEAEEPASETALQVDEATEDNVPAVVTSRELAGAGLSEALSAGNKGFTISRMDSGAKISGAPEQVAPGGRPGIFVALGKKFEEAASGDTVKVTVTIEAENPGLFSAAYSTADVGNSGWQSMQVRKGENSLSFNYAVPKLKKGNDDYVGVLPDPEATGQIITITAIKVEILPL